MCEETITDQSNSQSFNFEKFSTDFSFCTDKIKNIITELSTNVIVEDKDTMIQQSCQALVNLYLTASKIYENLGKCNYKDKDKDKDKNKDDKSKNNNIKTNYDKLWE